MIVTMPSVKVDIDGIDESPQIRGDIGSIEWCCVRMAIATLNLIVLQKRMLNKTEAAEHCGRSAKRFDIECPVQAVRFPNGDNRWDLRDLDACIDSLKAGYPCHEVEAIIGKLE